MINNLIVIFLNVLRVSAQQYNFAVQSGESNQIYLQEYTPSDIQAPLYQWNDNSLNLSFIQSVQQVLDQRQDYKNNILCASNYITESQDTSNIFWFLTNSMGLYEGIIDSYGNITTSPINIQLQVQNCYNLNLINITIGVLTCTISNELTIIIIDSASQQQQQYSTQQNNQFTNINTNIQILSQGGYSMMITSLSDTSAEFLLYNLNQNKLDLVNQQQINGAYLQSWISMDFSYIFLLSNQSIALINCKDNTSNNLIQISDQNQLQMTIFQVSESLFRLVLLSEDLLQLYYVYTAKSLSAQIKSYQVLPQFTNTFYFNMDSQNIYLFTNEFISSIQIPNEVINQNNQLLISNFAVLQINISKALVNFNRQMAIIFYSNNNNEFISTYLFVSPQILIFPDQSNLLANLNYFLNITISSQISQIQQFNLILNLISVNYNVSTCPITKQVQYEALNIEYPDYVTIPFDTIFQGPNLQQAINSSNWDILRANTNSNKLKGGHPQRNTIYSVICAYQQSIRLYCTQYSNYSIIISQWFTTQQIQVTPNSQTNINQCKCFETGELVQVIMQFPQEIIVQQVLPYFIQGNQTSFFFTLNIQDSTILKNGLFIITSDNVLTAYNKQNNNSLLFTIKNQNFKNIYTNELNYPNLLFVDNLTNLVIISFNGQNNYEYVNSISLPQTNFYQSRFGILNNGIYLALLTNSDSLVYFYPKFNIYLQTNEQIYYQAPLFSKSFYYANKIFSAYTSNHFYVLTYKPNNLCCSINYFKGTGSAFTAPTFVITFPSTSVFAFSVVPDFASQVEAIQAYYYSPTTQQQTNGSVAFQEYYYFIPYFQAPNISQSSTYVTYNTTNCQSKMNQNVNILYNRDIINIKQFNSSSLNLQVNQSGIINIDPTILFTGNLNNFTFECSNNCSITSYRVPLNTTGYIIPIQFDTAIQYNSNLYVQTNQSVYQIQDYQFSKVYDFPIVNSNCRFMFEEIVSGFLVSLCSSNTTVNLYAVNYTTNQTITNQILLTASYFKAFYQNGVLQITSFQGQYQKTVNYWVYFIWITNNTINLQQVYNANSVFTYSWIEFVILQASSNYSSQPCQIFGMAGLNFIVGYSNPQFYLIKMCASSQISQTFGFPGNEYTTNQVIFTTQYVWQILQTLVSRSNLQLDIIQIGSAKQLKDDLIEAQFIVPLTYVTYRYYLVFNSSDGTLLFFKQANRYYITHTVSGVQKYQMFQTNDGPLLNVEGLYNASIVNLYVYPSINNINNDYDYIQIIGSIQFNDFKSTFGQPLDTGDYILIFQQSAGNSIIYEVQDQISINIDMTDFESSELIITAYNDLGSAVQTIKINNIYQQQNDDDNEEQNEEQTEEETVNPEEETVNPEEETEKPEEETKEPEEQNNNGEESNDNNNNNNDPSNPEEDEDDNNSTSSSHKALIIVCSCVGAAIIIAGGIFLGLYLKKEAVRSSQQYVEMQRSIE